MRGLTNVEGRELYMLDGLRLSLMSEQLAYIRLRRQLRAVEQSSKPRIGTSAALGALASAWEVIDAVYRVRGLVGQVRGLSHRSHEYRSFVEHTSHVEVFRHFFQHMNSSINTMPSRSYPIMGLVCWRGKNSLLSHTLAVGHLTPQSLFGSMTFDTWQGRFPASIELKALSDSIELERLHVAVRGLKRHVTRWLKENGRLGQATMSASYLRFGIDPDAAHHLMAQRRPDVPDGY